MKVSTKKLLVLAAFGTAGALLLSGCTSTSSSTSGSSTSNAGVVIKGEMWDPTQLPVYKQCAAVFKKQTGITVDLTQQTWANYWSNLITQLSAGEGPDVFTDHVNYFAQLQSGGQLLDMTPYLKKDNFSLTKYNIPSNALWNKGGKQYALSQDKDVTGLLYNTKDIPSDISAASLNSMTWNPTTGGTFQKTIEHLTVDKNGNRGDSPAFDKNAVKTYGFAMQTGAGVSGQVSFSSFILSSGWYYTDKNPYGTKYDLSNPKMVAMWNWFQRMYAGGFIAPAKLVTSLGEQPVLDQNVTAMMTQGSWEAAQRVPSADKAQTFSWAQLPSGPVGHPVTITNSVGPSVNASSKHPAQAVKWAEFVVSPTCANIVAKSGVEIPTVPAAAAKALSTLKAQGVNTANWEKLLATPADLKLWPLTEQGAQINNLANTAFDDTLSAGTGSPQSVLKTLNTQINTLLK